MITSSNEDGGELRVYGNLSLLEMAPVLLAAERIYSGKTIIEHGGVMSLWGQDTDLPSLSASGRSDLAANSETQALRHSFENPDMRFIFTLAECPYRIVCRRSAGIARLADLRGKRIGTMLKSSAEYFLDRMLRTVGLTAHDVTIVPFMAKTKAPLTLMPQALLAGELDAVTVWEPQMQQAKLVIGADAIEFCDPTVYRERFN
jgi:sulfonate transport system substrate-binding protein